MSGNTSIFFILQYFHKKNDTNIIKNLVLINTKLYIYTYVPVKMFIFHFTDYTRIDLLIELELDI